MCVATLPPFKAGLQDVIAGTSEICLIDGRAGRLAYCGYDIQDLAEHAAFEEVIFLLYFKRLPTRAELADFDARLRSYRPLPADVLTALTALPKSVHPMAALRTAVSLLGNFDPDAEEMGHDAYVEHALRLTARMATLVAAWDRIRRGLEPVEPKPSLSHAANFLYMLRGKEPDGFETQVLNAALVLHADHELNASTFAARITVASLTDVYSAVVAAVGTLKGTLHGGANEQVMRMEMEIGEPDRAEAWVLDALARKQKIMGFGHRVYRTKDPRAHLLERHSEEVGRRAGDTRWFEITRVIEQVMLREKGLQPNVDLYSGSIYHVMSIPIDLFTPVFAVSRVAGWTAHILEQLADNRIIRPRAEYAGPEKLDWVPIDQR